MSAKRSLNTLRSFAPVLMLFCVCIQPPARDVTGACEETGVQDVSTEAGRQSATDRQEILRMVRKVADWQLAHKHPAPYGDWVQGPFLNGLMAIGRLPGQERYVEAARKIGAGVNYQVITTTWVANDHCSPQTWLELYEITKDPAMLEPTRKALDQTMSIVEMQDDMLSFTQSNRFKWSWCDALYMSPPTFARLARITGERKYADYLHEWWWKVSDFYYDEDEHLYFRDETFFRKREANGRKVFWSRGNGWVIGGLVRVLQYLPEDDPKRSLYEQQLREMCEKLAQIQCEDGLWRAGLLDPAAYPQAETSGSAFFVCGLAYAINENIVDRERYAPVADKAWAALCRHVKEDGCLTGVQPIGDSPVTYHDNNSMPYGVGAFLLAGSEMLKWKRAG